ncbi:MAG: hypothetical protein JXB26_05255 [Candidatus Aminicenantes bacterium]|nr:hypothetical protein [Candidatus Aminicenantes bacterium]
MKTKPVLAAGVIFLMAAALFMNSGCASFPANKLPEISASQYPAIQNKPSAYLDVKFFTYLKGKHSQPIENFEVRDKIISLVREVTEESQLFSTFTTDKLRGQEMDYIIQLDFTNYGNYVGAVIAGVISGITFGIIPTWVKDRYRLESIVYDEQGNELQVYKYEDHMTTVFHLVFIPMIGSTQKVPFKVIKNMLKNFYYDLAREEFFQQPRQREIYQEQVEEQQPVVEEQEQPIQEMLEIKVSVANAVVRLKPDPESLVISEVSPGAVLKSIGKKGEWYSVELPEDENGFVVTGYIHQDSVEEIKK